MVDRARPNGTAATKEDLLVLGLYRGAGATYCGRARGGRLAFAWALAEELRDPLAALGRAVAERESAAP